MPSMGPGHRGHPTPGRIGIEGGEKLTDLGPGDYQATAKETLLARMRKPDDNQRIAGSGGIGCRALGESPEATARA